MKQYCNQHCINDIKTPFILIVAHNFNATILKNINLKKIFMKSTLKLGMFLLFALTLFGCNNDEELNPEQLIIETWQLIEIYGDPGDGSGSWSSVDNGYKYIFTADNQFTTNRFSECDFGIYSLNSNKLILDFGCEGFTTGIENPEGTFIERMTFESKNLILNPTYLICDEGCGWKFKKVN